MVKITMLGLLGLRLIQKGVWEAVDPGFYETLTAAQKKNNSLAISQIFLIVEDKFLDDIGDCERASEAWNILEEIHTKYGLLHLLQLLRDIFNITKMNEAMKDYIERIMNIHRKLEKGGHGFKDTELALIMLMGLPKTYEPMILNLEQNEEKLSTKIVKGKLLLEEKRQLRHDTIEEETTSRAFVIKEEKQPTFHERRKYHPAEKTQEASTSHNYQKNTQVKAVKCFCCGKMGHIARNCRFNPAVKERFPFTENKEQVKRLLSNPDKISKQKAFFFREGNRESHLWYLDSGATEHMVSDRSKLTNIREISSVVETANKQSIHVTEMGDITFKVNNKNGGGSLFLKNVLIVPEIEGNLLSVGRIDKLGNTVIFENGNVKVLNQQGELLVTAPRNGNTYYIEEFNNSARITKVRADIWHRRLGHLNKEAVAKTNIGEKRSDNQCTVCMESKMKKLPFSISSNKDKRASYPLELIHSDVVGPINPRSKRGSNYFVTFIDDFSHYTVVYFIKNKNEVLEKFKEYKNFVENFHERRIKTLRFDNGKEYCNSDFDWLLIKNGIRRQLSVPRTPQQNGVSERMNQTLLSTARCSLTESGIPITFWGDAIHTACYLRNKTPSKAIDNKIPEELWSGRESKIGYLKVFGCKSWCSIDDCHRKSKFSPKAKDKDIILGVYVDLLVTTSSVESYVKFKSSIQGEVVIKDLGEVSDLLSVRIKRNKDSNLELDQFHYIEEILKEYGMEHAKEASTPLDPGMFTEGPEGKEACRDPYQQAIGNLLWLAGMTRPDIAYAVTYLSKFNSSPLQQHWNAVKHLLRYLKKTKDLKLVFSKTGKKLAAFADADWGSDKEDRKSYSGYIFVLGGAAISWCSRKQKCVALSTAEAEYYAMCEAAKKLYGISSEDIYIDNQGAMFLAENEVVSERSKHIDIRHFFIRDLIKDGKLSFVYVPTEENPANLFTKNLKAPALQQNYTKLGLCM
ncbi:hypothetical protein LAZ67_7003642 [Cordylochernes scorpioides]|uniref:Retrovirus-related Pol polyprotein from transposon TNT 1-94 n=1 Tax=Cordylochernes scorpioides TaxID=51811 RepID=A0ABY6KP31_9ARAC|nr:hypothetical protein LAZ67_7003642 [Cordylochernes scorpioides]